MSMRGWPLFLLVLPTLASATAMGPAQVTLQGSVTTGSGEHPAWLLLMCTRGRGGALSMQLTVPTNAAADFPFDAYEGPRAPASAQPSARITVDRTVFAKLAVGGWYSADMHDAFVFGVASPQQQRGTLAKIAAAFSHRHSTLRWAQNGMGIQTPPLIATFTPDEKQSAAIATLVRPCTANSGT